MSRLLQLVAGLPRRAERGLASRWAVVLGGVFSAAAIVTLAACSSSSAGLRCGTGTIEQGALCVALLPDATAGQADGASDGATSDSTVKTETGTSADGGDAADGADAGPVDFGGVAAVAPVSSSSLLAVWSPGLDLEIDGGALAYRVYVGPAKSPLSYTAPAITTPVGAAFAVIGGLDANTPYVVGVRAVNALGVEDENEVHLDGTPQVDAMVPTFLGAKAAKPSGGGAVLVSWSAAKDNLSPPAAITYLVYASATPHGQDFTQPAFVTAPGATSATVTELVGQGLQYFVVRARDAAGNTDTNDVQVASAPGADLVAPVFGGCTSAMLVSGGQIAVAWLPATDDVSPPAAIKYEVFQSTTSGQFDFSDPIVTVPSVPGIVTSVTIPESMPSTRYFFVCRAKDLAGNVDANVVQVSAVTSADPIPPTFGGIASFVPNPAAFSVLIGWSAATDSLSSPSKIVYDIYESTTPMGEVFNAPPQASSPPGALMFNVTNLPGDTTLYFVVRARDTDGNHDMNMVEDSLTTNVSYSQNIEPFFAQNCAVVGCHVPGNPTGNLILSPGFAYAQTVGVTAGESPTVDGGAPDGATGKLVYINPSNPSTSFLNIKMSSALLSALKTQYAGAGGSLMPAPETGSVLSQAELDMMAGWISQGAPQN